MNKEVSLVAIWELHSRALLCASLPFNELFGIRVGCTWDILFQAPTESKMLQIQLENSHRCILNAVSNMAPVANSIRHDIAGILFAVTMHDTLVLMRLSLISMNDSSMLSKQKQRICWQCTIPPFSAVRTRTLSIRHAPLIHIPRGQLHHITCNGSRPIAEVQTTKNTS